MRRLVPAGVLAAALMAAPAIAHLDVPGLDANGQCVGDANSDATVSIDEIITAVNNALGGCSRLPITLTFRGMVGDRPFACGTAFSGIGTGSSQFIPADFRFYVSGVKLVTVAGDEVPLELDQDGIWQYQHVALLDFETGPDDGCIEGNTALNTAVHGSVSAGVYTGLKFNVGIPFDLDHGNQSTAPSPLNFTAMFWSWNDGYKFVRIDTADDKFRVHVGSTGCDGGAPSSPPTTCSHPNVGSVSLTGFSPSHSVIVADIAALLADSDLDVNEPGTAPGCMADPDDQECPAVLLNLGVDPITGAPSPSTQKFFHLVTEHGGEHVEVKVAASAQAGGTLIAHPEFDVTEAIALPLAGCVGGTGNDCTGGTRLFSAANPGFEPIDAAEPEESLFVVADGVPITLAVTELTDGLTFRLGDQALDHAGATILLGSTPTFHADLEAQILLPSGTPVGGTYEARFQLTTTSAPYTSSDPIRVKFTTSTDNEP